MILGEFQRVSVARNPGIRRKLRLHVRQTVREAKSSFYWAMRILRPEQRFAIYAVYAFCREVDDIVDEEGLVKDMTVALNRWRSEIDDVFAGEAFHPTAQALVTAVQRYDLPKDAFLNIIDGMAMDIDNAMNGSDHAKVLNYCDKVAGAVGALLVRIFGLEGDVAAQLALHQGRALQLTNILRDLKEDADKGRLYLPANYLTEAGLDLSNATPWSIISDERVAGVCQKIAAEAEIEYQKTWALLQQLPHKKVRAAKVMLSIYQLNLTKLQKRGFSPKAIASRMGSFALFVDRLQKMGRVLRYSKLK